MTEAIEALDRALEKAEAERQVLSKAQADWLRNRYSIEDMAINCNTETTITPDGGTKVVSLGAPSMSEAHGNLLDDLHAIGLLSERDMEILNSDFLRPIPLVGTDMASQARHMRAHSSRHPTWRNDIVSYHRAMAEIQLLIYETSKDRNMNPMNSPYWNIVYEILGSKDTNPMDNLQEPPNIDWYREAAEVKNRLADILEQIF
jgi:hypothetical protein